MTATDRRLDPQAVREELVRLAEIAAGIFDGEEVKAIITEKAMHHVANPDPTHRFLSSDYYDVDDELFLRTKKLLTRLERLGKVKCSGSIWVPVPGQEQVTVAVQNGPYHRYYKFGESRLTTPPEMKKVLQSGQVMPSPSQAGEKLVTVLAPVRDSLGDVAAVMELTARLDVEAPAWS